VLTDLKYALRSLRKSALFTSIAVVCLAVGIAANTTMFSCFNAIVLRPLPFPDPDRLAYAYERHARQAGSSETVSYRNYLDWREQARSFSGLGATAARSLTITEGDEPERYYGQLISANLFPTLGVDPQLGRGFREDEDLPGAPGVVLLSDNVWRRRYNADSTIINRVISLENQAYTVVGVMPPRFAFPFEVDLWIPIAPLLHESPRSARSVSVYGRLQPTATVAQAGAELRTISQRLNAEYSPTSEWTGYAHSLREQFVEPEVRSITTTMFGAVTLVLLIACANVANLLLTRSAARQREIAVRSAIGAGRGRIVRQLLTESLVIAAVAGALAVPLTWLGLRLIDGAIPAEEPLPWFFQWGVDTPTMLYTLGIAAATSVLFGLAPALQVSRGHLFEALKEGAGRGAFGSAKRNKLRSTLVVAEVALSLVLLVGASLFARSFLELQKAGVGFDTAPILTMRYFLPGQTYDDPAAQNLKVQDIIARVEALPNVAGAASSNLLPLSAGGNGGGLIVEGQPVDPGNEPFQRWAGVSGHWFETLGAPLVAGRVFNETEIGGLSEVAIVNQTMANQYWPTGNALGSRFRLTNDPDRSFEVIGIAPDVRVTQLDQTGELPPMAYLPYRFHPNSRNNSLMVRVRDGNAAAVFAAVRQAIREADPAIPVFEVQPMEKVRQLSFWQYKLFSQMFGAFGLIALVLAAIGVYGVISYAVSQRTQEIGVRVALGAQSRNVVGMVLRDALVLAALGVGVGLVGAFGITRVIASFLTVSPTDPVSFGGVALFLTVVAMLASYVPARRAMNVDPLVALRAD